MPRARMLLLAIVFAATGCSVPDFLIDENFGDAGVENDTSATGDGEAIDSTLPDTFVPPEADPPEVIDTSVVETTTSEVEPDAVVVETDPPDTSVLDASEAAVVDTAEVSVDTGCKTNAECAATPTTPVCDVATGACVPCLPTDDVCKAGEYCTAAKACAPGCKTSAECTVENGTGSCDAHVCKIATCNTGFDDCNGSFADGCEVNLTNSVSHCGLCFKTCPSTLGTPSCVASVCKYASCAPGFGDCDGSGACATPITNDIANCGGCGTTCTAPNGTPSCTGTTCGIASCSAGFGNCNGTVSDGCEQRLNTATHCGTCGTACTRANAASSCSTGSCVLGACNTGFGNCDGNAVNGCETDTRITPAHCGGCGMACSLPNATAGCAASACTIASCNTNFANCDTSITNGCERSMTAAGNTCGTATALTDSGGSTQICATNTTETTTTVTGFGTRYYRIDLRKCNGGACRTADPMRARFTVTSPAGMAFDLRVFDTSACSGTPLLSSTSGVAGGTETVTYVEPAPACTTPKNLWIEVKWRSGVGCGTFSLSVTGAYFPYP